MHGIVVMLALLGLMRAARTFLPPGAESSSGIALAFGFLLLIAFFGGKALASLRLPKLTGYIVTGLLVGPSVFDLVTRDMVRALGPVQGVAICLIALVAGGELNVSRMRPLFRTIGWMMVFVVFGCAIACTLCLLALQSWLPFLRDINVQQRAAVCVVLGVSLAALSPAVVMALLSESEAEGVLSRTMLGVVVAADLVVIVLFALVASGAQAVLGAGASVKEVALHVSWELFGSALVGVGVGGVIALYLRKVKGSRSLFVLLVCVVMSEVGSRLALDPLIIGLSAGLFMENVAEVETTELVHDIEAASLPVYVVFFAVAGAALRLDLLSAVAAPALILVAVRFAAIWLGSRLAAKCARAEDVTRRWAFAGFLPQAGLALALPLLYPRVLPGVAEGAAALVLGIVGINQLLMPALLRLALVRSGEAGRAKPTAITTTQPIPGPDPGLEHPTA
jgi:Kef-type K+ transport system membrane component KefB